MFKKQFRIILCSFLGSLALFQGCDAHDNAPVTPTSPTDTPYTATVVVNFSIPGDPVNRLLLGNNIQWDDDGQLILTSSAVESKAIALKPTVIRFPGGTKADAYHWQDGIVTEHIGMGTLQLLELCDLLGSEPLITANLLNGTETEAVGWLNYINQTHISSRTGRTLPKAKYWEIGNEPYITDAGYPAPHVFAQTANSFIQSLRAADPTIMVILPMTSAYTGATILGEDYFNTILSNLTQDVDYVQIHNAYLPQGDSYLTSTSTADQWYWATMASADRAGKDLTETRTNLQGNSHVLNAKFAITEYSPQYALHGWLADGMKSVSSALYTADFLIMLANRTDVGMADSWSLAGDGNMNSGTIMYGCIVEDGYCTPKYYALQRFESVLHGNMLPISISSSETFSTADIGPVATNLPMVTGIATREGSYTRILLTNKDKAKSVTVTLNVTGIGSTVTKWASCMYGNGAAPLSQDPANMTTNQALTISGNGPFTVTLPPMSISNLTLDSAGGPISTH